MLNNGIYLEEQTIKQFKEILNIKKTIIEDGSVLDTDNLIALFTGEIDQLFKYDSYERNVFKEEKIFQHIQEGRPKEIPQVQTTERVKIKMV